MLSFLFIKNNPEKLAEAYQEATDHETKNKILARLMELNADSIIEQIYLKTIHSGHSQYNFQSGSVQYKSQQSGNSQHETQVNCLFDYIFKKNADSAPKIYEYFLISPASIKQKIIYQLIGLKADDYIKKLINTEYESQAVEYFLSKYATDFHQQLNLLKMVNTDHKKQIIKNVVQTSNSGLISKIYQSDYKEMLLEVMIKNFMTSSSLDDVFLNSQDKEIRDEIIKRILKRKIKGGNALNNLDFFQIAILKTQQCDIKEFLLFWEPYISFISLSESLVKHFYFQLNDLQKLYILLWEFGIARFLPLPELKYSLKILEMYYHEVNDCKSFGLTHICAVFDDVFNQVVEFIDYKLGILAYLIHAEQYQISLSDAEIFIEEMFLSKLDSDKEGYQNVEHEIEYLIFQKNFNQLKEIAQYPVPGFEQDIFFTLHFYDPPVSGCRMDIRTISEDTKIVESIENEKKLLLAHLDKMTKQMTDPKTLLKMKDVVGVKIANLVDINDFLFTLENINFDNHEDYGKLIDVIMNVLKKTGFPQLQKMIMKKVMNINGFLWSDYLDNDKMAVDDPLIAYYYNYLCKGQINPCILANLSKSLMIKPTLVQVTTITHLMDINHVAISRDAKHIATSGKEKTVQVLDINTNQISKYYHNMEIVQLIYSPDNRFLCSESKDFVIKLFDLELHNAEKSEHKKTDFEILSFSERKDIVAVKKENEFRLYDFKRKVVIVSFKHAHFINQAFITNNDEYVISYSSFELKIIKLSKPDTEKVIKTSRSINSMDVSSNSRYIIAGIGDRWKGELKIFDVETGKDVYSKEYDNNVSSVSFSNNVRFFAVVQEIKDQCLLSVYDMDLKSEIFSYNTSKKIHKVMFWPNTDLIISVMDNMIEISDYIKKKSFKILKYKEQINDCIVSFEGSWLVVTYKNEACIYHLLDITKKAAYNLVQNFLAFRLEQDATSIDYLIKNKEKIICLSSNEHKKMMQEMIDYLIN